MRGKLKGRQVQQKVSKVDVFQVHNLSAEGLQTKKGGPSAIPNLWTLGKGYQLRNRTEANQRIGNGAQPEVVMFGEISVTKMSKK